MNNQWPNYIYPYSWYNTSPTDDTQEKLYQTFVNYSYDQQEANLSYFFGQYPNQVSSYQPTPTVTTSTISNTPSVYNNFTTAGYGYPYYGYQNNTILNTVYQNPASTNLWNQAAASIGQAASAPQNTTAVPNAFGQTTSIYGNTSNPFRVSTPFPPTPPPRLRRQPIHSTCAKVIKKKTAPKKTFMQAFLEANKPKYPAPKPNNNKKVASADVFYARAPEPFETPGECRIEKIKNENFVPAVEYGQKDGVGTFGSEEATNEIDIEN